MIAANKLLHESVMTIGSARRLILSKFATENTISAISLYRDRLPSNQGSGIIATVFQYAMGAQFEVDSELKADLQRKIIWTLRSCARRERGFDTDDRRLLDPDCNAWKSFAGRLHEGDYVDAILEDNAARNPLALRPLAMELSAESGSALLTIALSQERHLLVSSSSAFLEAAAVAFGKPPLELSRVSAFEAIRASEQRILEFPSTAARVATMRAQPRAPIETYVGYVVESDVDCFLVGLAMLEFERNAMPVLLPRDRLEVGDVAGFGTFTRAASLGGEADLIALLPEQLVPRERITIL